MPHDITLPIWPSTTNCLAWSQDSILAIAAEGGYIELLIPKLNLYNLDLSQQRDNLWHTLHVRVNAFTEDEVQLQEPLSFANWSLGEELSNAAVVGLAWSPQGLGKNKRCVLAVLTSNCVLSVWAPGPDPTEAMGWRRVLIVNRVLERYLKEHGSLDELSDVQKFEIERRRQRIRAFAWSPSLDHGNIRGDPIPSDIDGPAWIAVANDCNEIFILRVKASCQYRSATKSSLDANVVIVTATELSASAKTVDLSDTFEECLAQHEVITQIAWSTWFQDTRSTSTALGLVGQYSLLACTTRTKLVVRRVGVDGGGQMRLESADVLEASFPASPFNKLLWFPKVRSGDLVLFCTCSDDTRRYRISVAGSTYMSSTIHPLKSWDEISGIVASVDHQHLPALMYWTFTSTLSDAAATTSNDQQPWVQKLLKHREAFNLAHNLDGHVISKAWGISSSPPGDLIATVSSQHPSDLPEYVITADYKSQLDISSTLGTEDFLLPSSGWNTTPSELSTESLVFSLLHWLNARKDVDPTDSAIKVRFVEEMQRFHDVEGNEELDDETAAFANGNLEHERDTKVQYLRKLIYDGNEAQSRRHKRLVLLLHSLEAEKTINEESTLEVVSPAISKVSGNSTRGKLSRKIRAFHIEACRLLGSVGANQLLDGHSNNDEDLAEYCGICGPDVRLPFMHCTFAIGDCGHQFARCGLTFLAIQAPGITKHCGICGKRFLSDAYLLSQEDDSEEQSINPQKPTLLELLLIACDRCIYCGGKFIG